MKEGLVTIKYTEKEIEDIVAEIKEHFNYMFISKRPITGVRNLANELERYPIVPTDKLLTLKYAAYLKYEIKSSLDYIVSSLITDPEYFKYKSNAFVIERVLNFFYGSETTISVNDDIIEDAIENASSVIMYEFYSGKAEEKAKTLSFKTNN